MKKLLALITLISTLGVATAFADWYVPLEQVPAAVKATAQKTYPDAQIWAVEMEHFNVYEVKMSNMMTLYINKQGQLLGQEWD